MCKIPVYLRRPLNISIIIIIMIIIITSKLLNY